ncbi:MAG: hypothetical protein GY715_05415 [Planctomycetes bacterium]|nr:hypothetical protein [Planctomycetota bacterium]
MPIRADRLAAMLLLASPLLVGASIVASASPPGVAGAGIIEPRPWRRVGAGDALSLEVTETLTVTGTVDTVGHPAFGRVVRRGSLRSHPGGWFIIADNADATVGEISVPGVGHYHLRATARGPVFANVPARRRLDCRATRAHDVAPAERPTPAASADTADPIIDVLVAWTVSARVAGGGTSAMEALADSYIAYTDMVNEASGVHHRLRLVGTAETTDVETGNILVDLADLRDPADGFADGLHDVRDALGADLVCLIVVSPSAGVAYRMFELSTAFASSAFSVVGTGQGGLVFAHEAGHNMGCAHNHEPGITNTIFCYSFGYREPAGVWNTIMSNPPGTHVDLFSSPDLSFMGIPMGVSGDRCPPDAADNVRSLNEAAATVAAFRATVVPRCPGDLDGSGDVGFGDVLVIIGAWGPCVGCPEDLDDSGDVGFGDVLAAIAHWGSCG